MPYDSNNGTIDPSQVEPMVRRTIVFRISQVPIVALLIYEILITMDREIKYFWNAPLRKPVTIIFFANRYLAVLGAIAALYPLTYNENSVEECKFAVWTSNLINFVNIISLDYILTIRVLALYGQARRLKLLLFTLLVLQALFRIIVTVMYCYDLDYIIVPIREMDPVLPICTGDIHTPVVNAYLDWAFPMVYGVLLLVLALRKAAEYWRTAAGFKGFSLVNVLIRDQVVYFGLVVFCCTLNIMQFKLVISNIVLSVIFQQAGSVSFLAILGSRILFNLKEAAERGLNEGTSYRPKSLSAMQFAQSVRMEVGSSV